MKFRGLVVLSYTALVTVLFLNGCGGGGSSYGWFKYAPPEGWVRYDPPTAITVDPTLVIFHPNMKDLRGQPRLHIRDTTEGSERVTRVPSAFMNEQFQMWEEEQKVAARHDHPEPVLDIKEVESRLSRLGISKAFQMHVIRGQGTYDHHSHVEFLTLPNGVTLQVEYSGEEPEFTQHLGDVLGSLSTLSVTREAPPQVPVDKVLAAFKAELDGERLMISDGQVEGQRLNDQHLEVLKDPGFANVTDVNLAASGKAMTEGTDITNAGLHHLLHLPLESLCLRASLVDDDGLAQLKELPLQTLILDRTLVTSEGIRHLEGTSIRSLGLSNTQVDDTVIPHLKKLPVVYLEVQGSHITPEGIAAIKAVFPQIMIME